MERILLLPAKKGGAPRTILVRRITDAEELADMYAQRTRVYKRYGYLKEEPDAAPFIDKDLFDDDNCVYIGAFTGGRIIGSLRLVRTHPLPIRRYFDFTVPNAVQGIPENQIFEISRLVVERTDEDGGIPRNIILLFLADATLAYAHQQNTKVAYAYIKERLLKKLARLRFPVERIGNFTCTYPHDGVMAPYFYGQPDDSAIPTVLAFDTVQEYLDATLRSGRMFDVTDGTYSLRDSVFNRFLSRLGIL
ncbi:MAG: acyl-homoserine-lactone synthase [bacterium]|nr:acyl-homoserine-lactone synthase [bacterium]